MGIQPRKHIGWCPSRTTLVLLGLAALAAVLLLAGHVDHVVAALPVVLILACPPMHLFMHGGHGGHDRASQDPRPGTRMTCDGSHGEEGEPMRNRLLLGIGVLIALAGLSLGHQPRGARAEAVTQTVQAGSVTIKATWQGVDAGPVFTIVLDTHAVDLDGYDLSQLATLQTDQGVEAAPVS